MLRKFYARVVTLGTVSSIVLILTTVMFVHHRMLKDASLNRISGKAVYYPKLSARGFKEDLPLVGTNWDREYYRAVKEVLQESSTMTPDAYDIPEIAWDSLNPNVVERGKVSISCLPTYHPCSVYCRQRTALHLVIPSRKLYAEISIQYYYL